MGNGGTNVAMIGSGRGTEPTGTAAGGEIDTNVVNRDTAAERTERENKRRQDEQKRRDKFEEDKRKSNIIIEGVDETWRGREGDMEIIDEILGYLECRHITRDIKYIDRIGRNTDVNRRKARLIMVEFGNMEAVREVLRQSPNLCYSRRFFAVYLKADESLEKRNEKWQKREQRRNMIADAARGNQRDRDPVQQTDNVAGENTRQAESTTRQAESTDTSRENSVRTQDVNIELSIAGDPGTENQEENAVIGLGGGVAETEGNIGGGEGEGESENREADTNNSGNENKEGQNGEG